MQEQPHVQQPAGSKEKCLVVGGAGFLGRHIVDALVNDYEVTTFDVRESGDPSAKAIIGDITKPDSITDACKGMDLVIHSATMAPNSESTTAKKLAFAVNVAGTENVIRACQLQHVPKLVYTSSASVVFEGDDLNNVDESAPYATRNPDYYTTTKIEAEKLVLAANGTQGVATIALRPSGIFGEWDKLFIPTVLDKAKQGKMKYILGNGKNLMEWTYAGNVADAHLLAAQKLSLGSPVAGKAYFITNNEPYSFWGFLGDVMEPLGYGRPRIRLPWYPLYLLASFLEYVIIPFLRIFGIKMKPSEFQSNRIRIAASNRTISCKRAISELAYKPKVSIREGVERTVAHFQPMRQQENSKKVQ